MKQYTMSDFSKLRQQPTQDFREAMETVLAKLPDQPYGISDRNNLYESETAYNHHRTRKLKPIFATAFILLFVMGLFIIRHGKQDIILSNSQVPDGKETIPQSTAEFIPVTNDLH